MSLPIRKLLLQHEQEDWTFEVRVVDMNNDYVLILDRKRIYAASLEEAMNTTAYARICQFTLDLHSVTSYEGIHLVYLQSGTVAVQDDLVEASRRGGKRRRSKQH